MEELMIKEEEAREKLVAVINDLQLPAFILEPIIKDIYQQIAQSKAEQLAQAKINQNKKSKKEKEVK